MLSSLLTTCILSTSSFFVAVGCYQPVDDEVKHTTDSFEKVKANIESKKAVIVDVREKSEWDAGHLKGAKFVPWSKIRLASNRKKIKELPDDELIVYCYCKAGARALRAAKKLDNIGYDVRPLKAGYEELVKNGFESAKKSAEEKSDEKESVAK